MESNLSNIKFIVLDVDGTMTDGSLYLGGDGHELKKFSVRDGAGILLARAAGIECIVLTGRKSASVDCRARELSIKYVFQGVTSKKYFLDNFLIENHIRKEALAYIGDDLNDLSAMRLAGITACPADACSDVKGQVDYVLASRGGNGAVREFIELILKNSGKWASTIASAFG